jgi:hypothetical protein
MRAWLWALILVGFLVAGAAVYATLGISWDKKITTYLTALKSQTGWDIRATSGSKLSFKGLHVQGLLVTGPRDTRGILRDVTFSLDFRGWLRGDGPFDQIHLGSLDITQQGTALYTQNDLTFSVKQTADHRLIVSGKRMALRVLMRPEQTDFDGVFGGNWALSGSWMPEGKIVFREPAAGFQGLAGSLTLGPQRVVGDLTLVKTPSTQNRAYSLMDHLAGLSLQTMIPESVDLTVRSDQVDGFKKGVARFHRVNAADPLGVDITGDHALGAFAASLTVQQQQGWQITLNTMRLGGIDGSGSWAIQAAKGGGHASHDIRLRLRHVALSPSSSMDLLSQLRGLEDQYHLTLLAEETKLGSVRLSLLETEMTLNKKALEIASLRMKTSLEGRFSLSGTLSYPTNTPHLRFTGQTAGPFFTDIMAFLPNMPKMLSYLNGDLQVKVEGYAHYPEVTLQHRDEEGAMVAFKGHLEPLTAPPRFNGVASYTLSPETQVTMTLVRGEKELRLSSIQGTLGGFPFSGQGNADLTVTPPMLQASLYAPTLSVQALSSIGNLGSVSANPSPCPAGQALPLPTIHASRPMDAQIRLRTDRLKTVYGDLTQVDQKVSVSEQGFQTSLTGHHERGHLGARMHVMSTQGLPILDMRVQAKDVALSDWGGSTTVSLKTSSWGTCLGDHLQTLTGQGSFKGSGMRPPADVLKTIQNLAGAALSRPLTPQDLDMRSVWVQGDFRRGTLTLQGAEVKLPAADISLQGALQMTSQRVNLRASVTSPQATQPIIITLNGPMARPDVQINNQSLWQYLLLGGGR